MQLFPNLPLRHRLTLFSLITSAVALLLASTGFILYEQFAFKKQLVTDVAGAAQIIGYNSTSALSFNDANSAEETLQGLGAKPHVVAACIYDKDGRVFATYPLGTRPEAFGPPAADAQERFGPDRLELSRPILLAGERIGTIYLRSDLREIAERLWRYAALIAAVMLVALLVAYVLAQRMQRSLSGPISELAAIASQVGADKNYSVRAVKRTRDELGRLIDGFNDMLGQIEARDHALRTANENLEKRVVERTAALQHERDLLRALLDSSPDTIYFKDTQSRFVLASRSKIQRVLTLVPDLRERRAAFGLPTDVPELELLNGLTDLDTYQNEAAVASLAVDREIMQTGVPQVGLLEKQVYRDGAVRYRLMSKMPWRDNAGQIIGTFGMAKDITELKEAEEKLAQVHSQLLETSRQAGMAEVATGVLHNVGNVLNSVNVSATVVMDHVRRSKSANIGKLATLLEEHRADLGKFMTEDSRGQMIPSYLGTLAESVAAEHRAMLTELEHLRKNIEHIKDIVSMQQSYARHSGVTEKVPAVELIEDALRMNGPSLARHEVELVRDFQAKPEITTDKHKVMQILVNLVRNAKHACDEAKTTGKRIVVRTTADAQMLKIAIVDNGVGIPEENLTRIFNHGFTTKKNGHGFGLHSGALAAKEVGGRLTVESAGAGTGATFTLELPLSGAPVRPAPRPAHESIAV